MKWTQQRSQNGVAARSRRRLNPEWSPEPGVKVTRTRPRAKWRLQLRDEEHGDSLTIRLYRTPWSKRWSASIGGGLNDALAGIKRAINCAA